MKPFAYEVRGGRFTNRRDRRREFTLILDSDAAFMCYRVAVISPVSCSVQIRYDGRDLLSRPLSSRAHGPVEVHPPYRFPAGATIVVTCGLDENIGHRRPWWSVSLSGVKE